MDYFLHYLHFSDCDICPCRGCSYYTESRVPLARGRGQKRSAGGGRRRRDDVRRLTAGAPQPSASKSGRPVILGCENAAAQPYIRYLPFNDPAIIWPGLLRVRSRPTVCSFMNISIISPATEFVWPGGSTAGKVRNSCSSAWLIRLFRVKCYR